MIKITTYSLEAMLRRIKDRKKEVGMTNLALSMKADIPIGTLAKILAGSETKDPQISSVIKIASALEVSCDFLIFGTSTTPTSNLTTEETQLLADYQALNTEGQEKASEYISDLVATGRYKKSNQLEMDVKKA